MKLANLKIPAVLYLTVVWLLFWGDVSVANVVSGIALAAFLVLAFPLRPTTRDHVYFRPLPFLHLAWFFVWKLLQSNLALTREVVRGGTGIRTAIIAVPVRGCSDFSLTSIANVTSLTPGTSVVEMSTVPPMLYLHVIHVQDEEKIRADVAKLNRITVQAFGSPADIEALDRPDPAYGTDPEGQP